MLTDTYIRIHIILLLAETPVSLCPPSFLWIARLSSSIVAQFAEAATSYSDYNVLPTYFPLCSSETINGIFIMHIVLYKSSVNVSGCSGVTGRERDAQCQQAS